MPLSEQEQRLLEEMERNLYRNDADFVSTVGANVGKLNVTSIVLGALLVLAGVGTLVVGVVVSQPLVGILGFIVMFGGVLVATTSPRKAPEPSASFEPPAKRAKSSSFMDGLNDRWERRQDERGN
ncbi:MAG: DUF3040 domain-containing protein [Microbacteriaceae bacterium]